MRISVVGSSGAGKTTTALRIAGALGVPHVELDALFWGPGWTEASAEQLRERVGAETAGDAWVIDGNYQSKLGTLVRDRADLVVWLDPPRWRVMAQSLTRTVRRAATGEELWSGNRETWAGLLFWRRDSILRWAWTTYGGTRDRYAAAMAAAAAPDAPDAPDAPEGPVWRRLRTRRDVDLLVAELSRSRA
ncbi:AAA family ATPase [Pimelobacter sp. 30-1]|uniref:AAA family ATPase n=1 Tax=Pimelobacter sp. 30-1 TaxID=2004991 RepID=UPI001C040A8D|nr:AAA family ATPase [Pimelobacter sp. 30-1]